EDGCERAWVHEIHHDAGRVGERPAIETIGREYEDIGILARRERADLAVRVRATGPLDGGEFEHVAAGEERRQVLLALARALKDEQALQRERRAHDGEKILSKSHPMVGAQARPHSTVKR